MKLKQIVLSNFRQFYNLDGKEQVINFSTDPENNITLIHAENGVGKTTLLNAILWCFYEQVTNNFHNSGDLVSHTAVAEGINTCFVEVRFEESFSNNAVEEVREYVVRRTYNQQTRTSGLKIHQVDETGDFGDILGSDFSGSNIPVPNEKSFINSILPKDMAKYFFFQGEGAAHLSNGTEGAKFKKAIRDILGFTFIEKVVSDLESIKKNQWTKLTKLIRDNKEATEASQSLMALEDRYEKLTKQRTELKLERDLSETLIEELEDKIRNSNHLQAQTLQRSLTRATNERHDVKKDLLSQKQGKQALIVKYGWVLFGKKLAEQGLDFINEADYKGALPSGYQDTFINDLLSSEECICGNPLKPGSESFNKVAAMLETANNALIKDRINEARSISGRIRSLSKDFLQEIEKIESAINLLDSKQAKLEKEVSELNDQLSEIEEDDISSLQTQKREAKSHSDGCLRQITNIERDLSRIESDVKNKKTVVRQKLGKNQASIELENYVEMIDELIQRAKDKLNKYEESGRLKIRRDVEQFLRQFSRKQYSFHLTESYDFYLSNETGQRVAMSSGETLLLNLAFVSSLIKHARDRSNASGKFILKGAVAPFVIDAPFGELDETYKKATSRQLPMNTEQLILFLSSSHWRGTVDEEIRNRIGEEYVLINNQSAEGAGKPLDEISIREKVYQQSIYNTSKNFTEIVRVSS
jgi:DNA sulfur modification protein DndD